MNETVKGERNGKPNGFEVEGYMRPMEGNSNDLIYVKQKMKNISKDALLEMVKNHHKASHLTEMRVIEKENDFDQVMYSRATFPLMSDRDTIMQQSRIDNEDGSTLLIMKSIDSHPSAPEPVQGVIRNEMMIARHMKDVGDDCEVNTFQYFDMKGYFPSRLLNMVSPTIMSKSSRKSYEESLEVQAKIDQ